MTDEFSVIAKYCGWLFIPRGLVGANRDRLRLAGRLMFRPDMNVVDKRDEEVLRSAFADWPSFLAGTLWRPAMYLSLLGGEERSKPYVGPDLGSVYGRSVQLESARALWAAAFPRGGDTEMVVTPSSTERVDVQYQTAALAKEVVGILGGLNTLAIAAGSLRGPEPATLRGHRPADFKGIRNAALHGRSGALRRDTAAVLDTAAASVLRPINAFRDTLLGPSDRLGASDIQSFAASPGEASQLADYFTHLSDQVRQDFVARPESSNQPRRALALSREVQKIAHHGWLLRLLGLVVDFDIALTERASEPATVYLPGAVAVDAEGWPRREERLPRGLPQIAGIVQLDAQATDETGSLRNRFELVQLDIPTTAHKLRQAVQSEKVRADNATEASERTFELPAQVTGGLSLVDFQAKIARDNASQKQEEWKRTPSGVLRTLFAEDITLGVRPDVQSLHLRENATPVQSPWRSLTRWRIRDAWITKALGKQEATELLAGVDAGEAFVGSTHRVVRDRYGSRFGKATDEVFSWHGWSLAVAHPDPGDGGRPAYSKLEVGNLCVTLESGGGLPALRVGDGYRVGVRAVYVDGGGRRLEETAAGPYGCDWRPSGARVPLAGDPVAGGTRFFPYLRYEPLAPPDIHLGEKIDYSRFPQAATRKVVLASSSDASRVSRRGVRYIVPPAVSLEQAVALGMYDTLERRGRPPESAFEGVCLTRGGRFPNVSNEVVPNDGVQRASVTGDDSDTIFHRSPFARAPVVPYLPDPWARRVIVGAFRASDMELLAIEYHDYYPQGLSAWPHCQALRLEVRRTNEHYLSQPPGTSAGRVEFAKDGSTIRLLVPPGENLRLHFWHEVDERVLQTCGIVDQMAEFTSSPAAVGCCEVLQISACTFDKQASREALIACLSRWEEMRDHPLRRQVSALRARGLTNITSFGMVNPTEVLDVVHAVDRPRSPVILWSGLPSEEIASSVVDRYVLGLGAMRLSGLEQTFRFVREPGSSSAVLAGDVLVDRSTTARLDFALSWSDLDDDLTQDKWQARKRNAVISFDNLPAKLSVPERPRYDRTANTRSAPDVAADDHLVLLDGVRTALKRESNEDLRDRRALVSFGDARARVVDIEVAAHSRFAAEFPAGGATCISAPGRLAQVVCPASAVPAKPDIDYVMPQYRWLDNRDGHRSHERVGGCFRVWLNRPWFSSGVDERLAVVCWPSQAFDKDFNRSRLFSAIAQLCVPHDDPPAFIEGLVTRWGLDPLWGLEEKRACIGSIPPHAFRNHICDGKDLASYSKEEACFPVVDLRKMVAVKDHLASYQGEDSKVALVLYEPKFEKGRYFVDIQVDERFAYTPFMRLALARYQKYALPGYELSEISVQEFVQLPPTRRSELRVVSSTRKGHEPQRSVELQVEVGGTAPSAESKEWSWSTEILARLEYLPVKTWETLGGSVPGELGLHGVAWVPMQGAPNALARDVKNGRWTLPSVKHVLRDDRIYSVVIEEYEVGFQDCDVPPPDGLPCDTGSTPTKCLRRRVFSDRLIVPQAT